jgi:uncharacterized protein Yka (UPF0111/DUF47 family)
MLNSESKTVTTTEQERAAYMAGDTTIAGLLARIADLERTIDELQADLYIARHERAYGGTE